MAVLTMLGVGHSEALEHWNNNAMIESGGRRLLIDAGYTIKFALRDRGLSLSDIDAVFITHAHADHCFGLERIGYECRFKHGFKPTLYLPPGVYEELWEHTLKGGMGRVGEGAAELSDFFEVVRLEKDEFGFEGVRLTTFPNSHTPGIPSYGLMINDRLLYSGDTLPIPDIVQRLAPATILHDATLSDWNPVHATVHALCESYPEDVRKRMYLMSYEDHFEEYLSQVEQEFAGFARQGQEFPL